MGRRTSIPRGRFGRRRAALCRWSSRGAEPPALPTGRQRAATGEGADLPRATAACCCRRATWRPDSYRHRHNLRRWLLHGFLASTEHHEDDQGGDYERNDVRLQPLLRTGDDTSGILAGSDISRLALRYGSSAERTNSTGRSRQSRGILETGDNPEQPIAGIAG